MADPWQGKSHLRFRIFRFCPLKIPDLASDFFLTGGMPEESVGSSSSVSRKRGRSTLASLQRRRAALDSVDLTPEINEMAARECAARDRRREVAAEIWAIRGATEAEFAVMIQPMERRITEQRRVYEAVVSEALRAQGVIRGAVRFQREAENLQRAIFNGEAARPGLLVAREAVQNARRSLAEAERLEQQALEELQRLEASLESTRETRIIDEGALDLPLMEPTDEEIMHEAIRSVTQSHQEKIRKLDEEIAALLPPW